MDLSKQIADAKKNVQVIKSLGKGGTLLDCGANIGEVSLNCAEQFQTVWAIEAHPDTYGVLCERVAGISNVITGNFAVASNGGLTMFASSPSPCSTGCTVRPTKRLKKEDYYKEVVTISLQELMIMAKPRVIKMDIEGCEYEVLESRPELTGVDALVVEFHNLTNAKYRERLTMIINWLREQDLWPTSPPKLSPKWSLETVVFKKRNRWPSQ